MERTQGGEPPLILVTNDDGIRARGIRLLWESMSCLGEVWVVAPARGHSGMSQAITSAVPLRVEEFERCGPVRLFAVEGTPTDCVKVALSHILPRRPSLVVSGINHGSNASINVLYSGTMGATMEGCIAGIDSVGFSQVGRDTDMTQFLPQVRAIAAQVLSRGLAQGVCLNVNLPRVPFNGEVRVCRQARARFDNSYEHRVDPMGRDYYWLTDGFVNLDLGQDGTDSQALHQGSIAIVPVQIDVTHYPSIEEISTWNFAV